EQARATQIDNEHEGQLALLHEFFDERVVHAGGHIPIDGAHLIPGLILAHLLKVHPLAFEDAMILASEAFADQAIGAQLDLADFLKDLARNHGSEMTNDE